MKDLPDAGDDVAALSAAVVKAYLKLYPGHRKRWADDLHSEAMLAICDAWEQAQSKSNPRAYLHTVAWNAINAFMAREAGQVRTRPDLEAEDDGFDSLATLRDNLDDACDDDVDRQILELREAGYKDREIGEQLGMDRRDVSKRRKRILENFREF